VILGAGYSNSQLEDEAVDGVGGDFTEDRQAWNVGADFDIGPFGLGAAYVSDNQGESDLDGVAGGDTADEEETWVLGADYTTGPFKLGASYMNKDNTLGLDGIDTDRYSGGVTYTYGPGMTFRGSVGYVDHEADGGDDEDATYVTVGTQINF
jgi:outer membrane protein OmpU